MRYVSVPLADQSLITTDNPLGWVDRDYVAMGTQLETWCSDGTFDGVVFQRAFGALGAVKQRDVGERLDGFIIITTVGTPDDTDVHQFVRDMVNRLPRALVYMGPGIKDRGYKVMRRLARQLPSTFRYAVDVAGQNTSWRVRRFMELVEWSGGTGIVEPTPLPQHDPGHVGGFGMMALAERYRTLDNQGGTLPGNGEHFVMYNNNQNGDSFWNAAEADAFEALGRTILQPIGSVA